MENPEVVAEGSLQFQFMYGEQGGCCIGSLQLQSGFAPGPKVPQFQGFLQLGLINIIRPSWLCHMYFRTATFFAHCIVVFIRSLPEHGVFAAPLFSSGNHFQPYLYALSVPLSSTLELNQASTYQVNTSRWVHSH